MTTRLVYAASFVAAVAMHVFIAGAFVDKISSSIDGTPNRSSNSRKTVVVIRLVQRKAAKENVIHGGRPPSNRQAQRATPGTVVSNVSSERSVPTSEDGSSVTPHAQPAPAAHIAAESKASKQSRSTTVPVRRYLRSGDGSTQRHSVGSPEIGSATSGSQFNPPRLTSAIVPVYPEMARRRGWEGVVQILATVDKEGVVSDARVIDSSGHSILDNAALNAVTRARFFSAERGRTPIVANVIVPIRFRLTHGQ